METVKVMMELPALPEGWEYTGEFRPPEDGEHFFNNPAIAQAVGVYYCCKHIVRKAKWVPVQGEYYYWVRANGKVERWNCCTDDKLVAFGNCFKTREEAEVVASKFKKLLAGE